MTHCSVDHESRSAPPAVEVSTETWLHTANRIPYKYFVTQGSGQSDLGVHAGSYHFALRAAGIERCNIMTYSSILPAVSREAPKPPLVHGSVLESILSVAQAEKGEMATAGLIYAWLYDRETGLKTGGLVCEHGTQDSEQEVSRHLHALLDELYHDGFAETNEMRDIRCITESLRVEKRYGTAITGICFSSYLHPVMPREVISNDS